jgi:hypothetical protein
MRRRLRLGDLEDDEGPPVAAAPQPTTIINTVQEPFDYSRLNKVETTVSICKQFKTLISPLYWLCFGILFIYV